MIIVRVRVYTRVSSGRGFGAGWVRASIIGSGYGSSRWNGPTRTSSRYTLDRTIAKNAGSV